MRKSLELRVEHMKDIRPIFKINGKDVTLDIGIYENSYGGSLIKFSYGGKKVELPVNASPEHNTKILAKVRRYIGFISAYDFARGH